MRDTYGQLPEVRMMSFLCSSYPCPGPMGTTPFTHSESRSFDLGWDMLGDMISFLKFTGLMLP